jgi:dihydrofolate reductase
MHVAIIAVQSIDGCITRHRGEGAVGWASEEDQQHFRRALATFDCAIFGAGTYRADRDHIRPRVQPDLLRMVMTRNPDAFAGDGVADQLEFTAQPPADVVAELSARGRQRCALLGGQQVYGQFFQEDLVDELILTLEPVIFGEGLRLCDQPVERRFELAETSHLSPSTLLLRYMRREKGEVGNPGRSSEGR